MKNFLSLVAIMALGTAFFAQTTTPKNMTVKMTKNHNGVITTIDTVMEIGDPTQIDEILGRLGIDADTGVPVNGENAQVVRIEVGSEKDNSEHQWIQKSDKNVDVQVLDLKDMNIEEMMQKMGDMDEEQKAAVMKALERVKAMKTSGERKGEMRIIHVDADVEIDENGESPHVMMFKSKDGKIELDQLGEGEIMEVDVRHTEEKDGDDVRILKEIRIVIKLEDINDDDKAALKRAGAPVAPSISKSLQLDNLIFYPNPTNDRFRLRFNSPDQGDVNIRVVNMEGKTMYSKDIPNFSGDYDEEISMEGSASGAYLLSISQNGKTINKKLVKN
ncbi:MAG: T9SS type A sorting domain-containing protein [Bacteroidia bacterium]